MEAGSLADASLADLLDAMAAVAPRKLFEFVSEAGDAIRTIPPKRLSSAISRAFDAFEPGEPQRTVLVRIAERHASDLTPATAALLFDKLGSELSPAIREAFERTLARYPGDPQLLRVGVTLAEARGDDDLRDALLTRLALADRSPATVGLVCRSRQRSTSPGTVRIALLSSYTIDPLVPYVDLACRSVGLVPEIYVAPFNSWARELLDEGSGLRRFAPDLVFLAVSIDDLIPTLSRALSPDDLCDLGDVALARVLDAARNYAAWSAGAPLIVHSFHSAFSAPLGVWESSQTTSRSAWLASLNARLAAGLAELPGTFVLDVSSVAGGESALRSNPKLRHVASMRLPPQALEHVADAYLRYIVPAKGGTRKCVVVDLDDTLWGGIVGEDGSDGIQLGQTAPGSEFVEFQEFLQSLAGRGILLAINSKNNPADALEVIRNHPSMVLREAAFSSVQINWRPKAENMLAIAQDLNIGLDSLVFVDNNPDEREQMRQLAPAVLTVDLPRDPAQYRSVLERLPQLQTLSITDEDRSRTEQYKVARLREHTRLSATSVDEYLRSLAIEVDIAPASQGTLARIAQLFARTNQFNTTTRRYDAAYVRRFAEDPSMRLWVVGSRDRFGDHGLVAVALVRTSPQRWEIDSFLMSCRVIGYGIETALLAYVADAARSAGARELVGEFVETPKNAPANELYLKHGFEKVAQSGEVQQWRCELSGAPAFPSWIRVVSHDA